MIPRRFTWPDPALLDGEYYRKAEKSRKYDDAYFYVCDRTKDCCSLGPVHLTEILRSVAWGLSAGKKVRISNPPTWAKVDMLILVELIGHDGKIIIGNRCLPLKVTEAPHRRTGTIIKVLNLDTAFARDGAGPDVFVSSKDFVKPFQGLRIGDRISFELEPGSDRARKIKYLH